MIQANIHQAKTQLSRLIERAEAGEEVVIARSGKPAVRLTPVSALAEPRPPAFGALHGRIKLAPGWEQPAAQIVTHGRGRDVVGCMAEESQLPPEDYLRRLSAEIAAEMLDVSKFDVELDSELEFIPAATR